MSNGNILWEVPIKCIVSSSSYQMNWAIKLLYSFLTFPSSNNAINFQSRIVYREDEIFLHFKFFFMKNVHFWWTRWDKKHFFTSSKDVKQRFSSQTLDTCSSDNVLPPSFSALLLTYLLRKINFFNLYWNHFFLRKRRKAKIFQHLYKNLLSF